MVMEESKDGGVRNSWGISMTGELGGGDRDSNRGLCGVHGTQWNHHVETKVELEVLTTFAHVSCKSIIARKEWTLLTP